MAPEESKTAPEKILLLSPQIVALVSIGVIILGVFMALIFLSKGETSANSNLASPSPQGELSAFSSLPQRQSNQQQLPKSMAKPAGPQAPKATKKPSPSPTKSPSPSPTSSPSPSPSPTSSPTSSPTESPTPIPSVSLSPTPEPSNP